MTKKQRGMSVLRQECAVILAKGIGRRITVAGAETKGRRLEERRGAVGN